MINTIVYKKFSVITKKYNNFYKISYHDFYQYILKKTQFTKNTSFFFIKNLILITLSLYTIIKFFLFKKNIKANYFIIKKKDKNFIDERSCFYVKKTDLKSKLNFIKSENFKESLIIFFSYPNIIYIYSFKYFINFFIRIKKKDNFYKKVHKQNYLFYLVLKKIFLILRVKEIHLIDDYRIVPLILSICNELKISSVGYMHGRISKYNIIHKYFTFNKIYVWSNYFRNKLIKINYNYKHSSKIIINKFIKFSPRLLNKFKKKKNYTKINLLYVLDAVSDPNLIINSLKKIKKYKKINLYIKFRPNENVNKALIDFCLNNNINFFYKEDIYKVCLAHRINFIISSYSTVLVECSLFGIYPLMLVNKDDDLLNELILDKVVVPIYSFNNFYKKILKLQSSKNILKNIKQKVWQ